MLKLKAVKLLKSERVCLNAKAVNLTRVASASAFIPARTGLLQRKCACGGTPGPAGQCAACRRKRPLRQPSETANHVGPPAFRPPRFDKRHTFSDLAIWPAQTAMIKANRIGPEVEDHGAKGSDMDGDVDDLTLILQTSEIRQKNQVRRGRDRQEFSQPL